MIDLKDLLEYCQAEAIANRMNPTEDSLYRYFCREYSEKFFTPLYLVLEMDAEHVLLNVYEKRSENIDLEDYQKLDAVLDSIKSILDPNYENIKVKEQDEFDKQAELEEEERVKDNKPVYVPKKKTLFKKEQAPVENRPTQGSINLDYLSRQDSED